MTSGVRTYLRALRGQKAEFIEDRLSEPIRELVKVVQARTFESRYFGVPAIKNPLDFWIYQEIIWDLKPKVIVEIGTSCGGSSLALAHLLDQIGEGSVVTVDLDHSRVPSVVSEHQRIKLVTGDACNRFPVVSDFCRETEPVMVIEDSSHTYMNTLTVLRTYGRLVTHGSYFIVEDCICHHGLDAGPNPGPYEAVKDFLSENKDFEADRSREAYLLTWNPCGYLRRK